MAIITEVFCLPFLGARSASSGEPPLGRFLGASEEPVLRAAAPLAVLVTAATAADAAALTVAGLAPFSMEGESAGPIMSMLRRVSAAAIPAPGDPMRSSAADCTVPTRCGGGVAVAGRPASASTAAVRCGGSGSAGLPGLGAWMRGWPPGLGRVDERGCLGVVQVERDAAPVRLGFDEPRRLLAAGLDVFR